MIKKMQSVCHVLVEGIEKSLQWWWDPFLSKCWLLMNNNNYMVQSKASMIYNCITRDTINTKPANYYCDDHLIWKEHYFYKGMGEDLMYLLVSEYVLNGLIVSVWVRFWSQICEDWRLCGDGVTRQRKERMGDLVATLLKALGSSHWSHLTWLCVVDGVKL